MPSVAQVAAFSGTNLFLCRSIRHTAFTGSMEGVLLARGKHAQKMALDLLAAHLA